MSPFWKAAATLAVLALLWSLVQWFVLPLRVRQALDQIFICAAAFVIVCVILKVI